MDAFSCVSSYFRLQNDVSECSIHSTSPSIKQIGLIAGTAITSFTAGYYIHYMNVSSIAAAGFSIGIGVCCYFKYFPKANNSDRAKKLTLCIEKPIEVEENKHNHHLIEKKIQFSEKKDILIENEKDCKPTVKPPLTTMQSKWGISKSHSAPLMKNHSAIHVIHPKQRNWLEPEIDNFINAVLTKANTTATAVCYSQFERMDETSIKNLTLKLVNEKLIEDLWCFEKKVTNQGYSIEKRKERVEIICSTLNEFQIGHSTKCESFWEVVCNSTDGYVAAATKGFSSEQLGIILDIMPQKFIGRLSELLKAFAVPETESERKGMIEKVSAIEMHFKARKPELSVVPFNDLKAVENSLKKLGLVLKIGTMIDENALGD